MHGLLRSAFSFLFHLGYTAPLLLGILDSSFLVLPFGNDLLIVTLIARNHHGFPLYVLMGAAGSTMGVFLLSVAARRFGEAGVRKVAGDGQFEKLSKRVGSHSGVFIALACVAPPPFPFTMVIAAASALDYPLWKLLTVTFVTRSARFALLGILAIQFGAAVLNITRSRPFFWSMVCFILLSLAATAVSTRHWLKAGRRDGDR